MYTPGEQRQGLRNLYPLHYVLHIRVTKSSRVFFKAHTENVSPQHSPFIPVIKHEWFSFDTLTMRVPLRIQTPNATDPK